MPSKVAYARVPSGPNVCGFCLDMAARGAAFDSERAAGGDGNKYHDRCHCVAVPVWQGDDLPYRPDDFGGARVITRPTSLSPDALRSVDELAAAEAFKRENYRALLKDPRALADADAKIAAARDAVSDAGRDAKLEWLFRRAEERTGASVATPESVAALRGAIDAHPIAVNMKADGLAGFLREGKSKTVFDVGGDAAGKAAENVAAREAMESTLWGAAQHPTYGYVSAAAEGSLVDASLVQSYGRFRVVVNDSVKSRSTYTFGDSLDDVRIPQPYSALDSAAGAGHPALLRGDFSSVGPNKYQSYSAYIEAQIHGGISIGDVERIEVVLNEYLDESDLITDAMRATLDGSGIPWSVIKRTEAR